MSKKILLLPGDGIGPEVVAQAKRVLEWFNVHHHSDFVFDEAHIGGIAVDKTGSPFPAETEAKAKAADAILLGAVGGPKYDALPREKRAETGLLAIRKSLDLFANLRPAIVLPALAGASSLKEELIKGLDMLIVRELTGGIYFGQPQGVETLPNGDKKGFNTLVYTTPEIKRIAKVAFELAQKRGKKLCSVDKANVLVSTALWREVVEEVAVDYPDVELSHMYVDNAAMQIIRQPKQFDVMVTTNMFGDILSDAAAMLTGSLGMLPSASLSSGESAGLYEPVHGSAPDIAGKNLANPLATILSVGMMLRYSFNMQSEADMLDEAVGNVLDKGIRTGDIMAEGCTQIGTTEMGDALLYELEALSTQHTA